MDWELQKQLICTAIGFIAFPIVVLFIWFLNRIRKLIFKIPDEELL